MHIKPSNTIPYPSHQRLSFPTHTSNNGTQRLPGRRPGKNENLSFVLEATLHGPSKQVSHQTLYGLNGTKFGRRPQPGSRHHHYFIPPRRQHSHTDFVTVATPNRVVGVTKFGRRWALARRWGVV